MIEFRWHWDGAEWVNQFGQSWPAWLAEREAFFERLTSRETASND